MVNLAGSRCFARFRKNILILTKPRANAQRVVKSVVIPKFQRLWKAAFQPQTTPPRLLPFHTDSFLLPTSGSARASHVSEKSFYLSASASLQPATAPTDPVKPERAFSCVSGASRPYNVALSRCVESSVKSDYAQPVTRTLKLQCVPIEYRFDRYFLSISSRPFFGTPGCLQIVSITHDALV